MHKPPPFADIDKHRTLKGKGFPKINIHKKKFNSKNKKLKLEDYNI